MQRCACLLPLTQSLAAHAAPPHAPDLDKKSWHQNEKMENEIDYSSALRVGDTL